MNLAGDPTYPWSIPGFGLLGLAALALLLAAVTVWTYLGVPGATPRRVAAVLGFRLLALVIALLTLLRPSFAMPEGTGQPSVLLVAVDDSESMTIQDEREGQPRWDALVQALRSAGPQLRRLREQHNVTILFSRFATDVRDFDPEAAGRAEGKRSDYAAPLQTLLQKHAGERGLRGLLVLGDGAHNGLGADPLHEAQRWRPVRCPVHTFAVGQPNTGEKQNDIVVTSLQVKPSPVPVKSEMTVEAAVDAAGFEGKTVRVRVFLEGKEMAAREEVLRLTTGNLVRVKVPAPAAPGEVKVALRIEPLQGETTVTNNELATYVDVIREGVNVLLVDKARVWEPTLLARALVREPRISLFDVTLHGPGPAEGQQPDLFQFDRRHYDVILLGDVTAARLRAGNPRALETIRDLVEQKGAGLLVMGGRDSLGNSDWQGTPLADLLPVGLEAGQVEGEVKMTPTEPGLRHYLLRLAETPEATKEQWDKLRPLDGMNRLGPPKPDATVYAAAGRPDGDPLLVGRQAGKGRVLAFAGDTTYRWLRPPNGHEVHARFWRQVVLWLAQQDKAAGNVWVKPEARRLPAGGKLDFAVGVRGKGGVDLPAARFEVKVIGPAGDVLVPVAKDQGQQKGLFWKTDAPGEYRLLVKGEARDADGAPVSGEAAARFLVYQDEAELLRRAADHDFLQKLAAAGGGRFHRLDELAAFLQELEKQQSGALRPKVALWPDWRRAGSSGALGGFFLLFVAVLSAEWFLRRRWGLA